MKNYFLFLDESGHHGLKTIRQEFPILLLSGILIEENYYTNTVIPVVNKFKEKYFTNKNVILHSRDIRKWQKDFQVLGDIKLRHNFYNDLDKILQDLNFKVIASAILKDELIKQYGPRANNPYDLSLTFILERAVFYTDQINCKKINVIAEARGKKEDNSLHHQYQVVINHGTKFVSTKRFKNRFNDIDFKKKKDNTIGLQISDLVAYPLATKILFPKRENLAFKTIEPKIYRPFKEEDYLGYGLKIFP